MADRRFQVVDDTCWTIDVEGELQWILRYGWLLELTPNRYVVASMLAAYADIINNDQPLKDSIAKLRLARQAWKQAYSD